MTRNTELKPVAWIHTHEPSGDVELCRRQLTDGDKRFGWTETPLYTRPAPSAALVEALEKLARLGNEPHYGNSDGNMIARQALAQYEKDSRLSTCGWKGPTDD